MGSLLWLNKREQRQRPGHTRPYGPQGALELGAVGRDEPLQGCALGSGSSTPSPSSLVLLSNLDMGPVSIKPVPVHRRLLPSTLPQPHSHVLSLPDPPCAAGAVRASSIFPILSVILLFMGGLCIAASEFYKTRHNIILSAGIFFVSAGNGH